MSAWARELAGWVLLGIGLAAFAVCYVVFLLQRRILEAGALGFMGFTVFRGGLHLLKVAVAARAAIEAGKPLPAAKPAAPSIRLPGAGGERA
jgi:hypothetical protein